MKDMSPIENLHPHIDVFDEVTDHAVNINNKINEKYAAGQNGLTSAALHVIHTQGTELHLSIRVLCENGRCKVAPIILRSMIECLAYSYLIISKDSEYRAFRFFSLDYLNSIINEDEDLDVIQEAKTEMEKLISGFVDKEKERVQDYYANFLQQKQRKIYWFRRDIANNLEEITASLSSDVGWVKLYRYFSAAVHTNYIGTRLFTNNKTPNINPEYDLYSSAMALTASIKTLFQTTCDRRVFEQIPQESNEVKLDQKINLLNHFS
jgi:hypothetical protein